jgi:hypothetical protein
MRDADIGEQAQHSFDHPKSGTQDGGNDERSLQRGTVVSRERESGLFPHGSRDRA